MGVSSPQLLLSLLTLASLGSIRTHRQQPTITPFTPGAIYHLNDKIGWHVAANGASGKLHYSVKKDNAVEIKSGEIDLSQGNTDIDVPVSEPAMLYMEVTPGDGGRKMSFGAAVEPFKLAPVAKRPSDFDAFWKSEIAALEAIPANPKLTPADSGKDGVDYFTIQMDHVNGTHVYGQLAKPSKPGKYPAILILQWASPPYPLQRAWVTDLASKGWLALNIEPHDVLPREPQSYYNALPATLKNYGAIGQDDRDHSYFVEMYLRDYRAADYLSQSPDWDGRTLVVTGGSMGGQQSLCVAGLHPKITHVIVEEPAGCDLSAGLHGRQEGYPFFYLKDPKIAETAQYVDAVNFASHIKATSLVAMGFCDNVAPPTGIWTAFNQIRGPKEAAPMPEAPHNNTATYEQQLPYYRSMGEWLDQLVKGEKVKPVKLFTLPKQ